MPGQTRRKELYLSSNLGELQKNCSLPPASSVHHLLKTLPNLLNVAKKERDTGDEEKAYVLYMKAFTIMQKVRASSEYKKDKKYYDNMIGAKEMNHALETLEALTSSLEERYKDKEEHLKVEKELKELRLAENRAAAAAKNGTNSEKKMETLIEPTKLYSLMKEKATTFLLLDVRPSTDYKASHIDHHTSLNIPGEQLKAGSTAKAIERIIHIEARSQWTRRTTVDKLILFDWDSEQFQQDKTNVPLTILHEAIVTWDRGNSYKSKPCLLKGGFENFAMHYQTKVTNPHKARKPVVAAKQTMLDLNTVEFPDLDNAFITSPTPNSSLNNSAVSVVANGAITITKNSPAAAIPLIPDRKSKPTNLSVVANSEDNTLNRTHVDIELDDDLTTSTTTRTSVASSVASEFNNGMVIDSSTSSSSSSSNNNSSGSDVVKAVPKIDRSLKARLVLKEASSNSNVLKVIEAESDLVEDTLELERKHLEMESRWEMLRLRREKAAEEEMKLEVMKKEELLLEELQRLSEEKSNKESENEKLRSQLKDMREKLDRQTVSNYAVKAKQDDLSAKESEMKRVRHEVEQKRQHRVEKEKQLQLQLLRTEEAKRKREQVDKEVKEKELLTKAKLKSGNEPATTSNLNRSHSSPNIAKMLDEEDERERDKSIIIPTPKFDRTSKPSVEARNRNFAPIWGTGKRGLTGLKNLGNTCYLNSVLQCLSNFTLPSQYFMGPNFKRDINRVSSTKGDVAVEFAEVIRALWCGQYRSIMPVDLKRALGRYNDMFRGTEQQDAHELLITLMCFLHQDVNEVREKVILPEQKNDNVPEMVAAQKALDMDRRADQSFIRETFYGQWRSSLTCLTCQWESVKYEPFFELSLQLPSGNGRCTLRQCIESYLGEETLKYKCPKCSRERDCVKKFEIVKLPLILTIQLKRFNTEGFSRKKQNFVDFELTDMDLGKYATACNGQLNRYKDYTLYGVCNHFGSMDGGHYTAYCYSQVYGKWYKYDDHEVYEMDPRDVKSTAAYMLFYSVKN